MKEYIIDTEFIRTYKNEIHFLEIAMLCLNDQIIYDYHFDVKLNPRDKSHIKRATSGKYGQKTQKVFETVKILLDGSFEIQKMNKLCEQNHLGYNCIKLDHLKNVKILNEKCILYAWDTSNDKCIMDVFKEGNLDFIDVQFMWQKRFGGPKLSLINAYKYVLYNMNLIDEKNLIENAHFASGDVLMLKSIIDFIRDFNDKLKPIPMLKEVRDKEVAVNNLLINKWETNIDEMDEKLLVEDDETTIKQINKQKKRLFKKKMHKEYTNQNLLKYPVYTNPWWINNKMKK